MSIDPFEDGKYVGVKPGPTPMTTPERPEVPEGCKQLNCDLFDGKVCTDSEWYANGVKVCKRRTDARPLPKGATVELSELRAEVDELEKQMHDWVFETDDDVKKENLTLRAENANLKAVLKGRSDIDDLRFEMAMEENAELRDKVERLKNVEGELRCGKMVLRAKLTTLRKIAGEMREAMKDLADRFHEFIKTHNLIDDHAVWHEPYRRTRNCIAAYDVLKGEADVQK